MPKYRPTAALLEHMLEGHAITLLEAMLIFGVQSPNRAFTSYKRDGFLIEKRTAPMSKVIRRINECTRCSAPENLPVKEIQLTEYWIKK